MKRVMKKMCIVFSLCLIAAGVPLEAVNASELSVDETGDVIEEQAEYDMEAGGTQTFEVIDEDGEEEEVIIEEMPRIARVAKGTYKITRKKKGAWSAGFYVDISSNKITRAYDKFYSTSKGRISNAKLTRNSNVQATLSFSYTNTNFSDRVGVRAKIINKKLVTSML